MPPPPQRSRRPGPRRPGPRPPLPRAHDPVRRLLPHRPLLRLATRLGAGMLGLAATGLVAAAVPAAPGPPAVPAAPRAPVVLRPADFPWVSPPGNPRLRGAWMLGGEQRSGPYVLRVSLAKGGRIPVHTHPDTRFTTVLSGTLLVGFGERVEEAAMVAIPAGAIYVAPAGVPHFLWARDGDVVYQESGVGPTATVPLRP